MPSPEGGAMPRMMMLLLMMKCPGGVCQPFCNTTFPRHERQNKDARDDPHCMSWPSRPKIRSSEFRSGPSKSDISDAP